MSVVGRTQARRRRVVVVVAGGLAVAVAVAALWRSGALSAVTDAERLRATVEDSGPLGPAVFLALFTLLVPVGVPGLVFVVAAALLWPAPPAVALCVAGAMTSSVVGLVASRYVARDALARRFPPRLRAWDERIARGGLWPVVAIRLVLYLAAPADWILGLSAIPMRTILIGTFVGMIPPTVVYVVAGRGALGLVMDRPVIALVTLAVLSGIALQVRARIARGRAGRQDTVVG